MSGARSLGVAIRTLGCKVNRAESETIATELLGGGAFICDEDEARVIVVNTCTVTGEADAKARKAIRQALTVAGEPVVVVTGCLAALDAEALRALGQRVVVEPDKSRVADAVAGALGLAPRASAGLEPAAGFRIPGGSALAGPVFRTRVALKIQDGCDHFCTYCIVPHARGVPRSTSLRAIRQQAERLVAAGTREIVLTGVNLGRYADCVSPARSDRAGHDQGQPADLADVVAAVAASGIERIRLSSIEPLDLTPRLLGVLAATPAVCAHLHVPLQSGSDDVLAAMGRGYTTADFADCISRAREALPGLVVTTDVLAGFPGETDEDAARTLAFCESIGFAKLHVFRYSKRPGTPAAERDDQVPPDAKTRRAAALRGLSRDLEHAHASGCLGGVAEVLVERVIESHSGTAVAEGTTRDYLRVRFSAGELRAGDIARVRLSRIEGGRLYGECIG